MRFTPSNIKALLTGTSTDPDKEGNRRFIMVITIGLLAAFILAFVATGSLLQGEFFTALVDYCASFLLVALLIVYRFTDYKRQCRLVGVLLMYALYMYLFATGAANGNTYMWHYTFPFFAIFLIGSSYGSIATLLLFVPVFTLVIQDAMTPEYGRYSVSFAIRFIPSVSVALIFAFLFGREQERFKLQARQAHDRQEAIIAKRSAQLYREVEEKEQMSHKLQQAQKMKAIGTMASGVAHDLNNILSGIVTYPQLIRLDLPEESPINAHLIAIEQAGKRAALVVNDLLTISRDAASVKEPTNLNTLIQELLESPEWKSIIAPHSNLKVKAAYNAKSAFTLCSPSHIRKSVMNLLLNGVEATLPGGTVRIETSNHKKVSGEDQPYADAGYICVTISDQGPGIPPEQVEHIFEPFFTTKKMGRSGSGLGLSVVWNTIEEHKGEIFVDTTPEGGRFSFQLATISNPSPAPVISDIPTDELKGSGSILIIEDDPQLYEITSSIVERLGYSGTIAPSGEEAVKIVREQEFDLLLLDMVLGEGPGGYETYHEIIKIRPHQKAIIVSGYSTSDDVEATLDLGAASVIKKPYSISELGQAIKDCLGSQ